MRKILLLTFLLLATLPARAATYYISKSLGADTHTSTQSESKSTPWAHFPCMHGATSNAASYCSSIAAGDHFILYGGDTWGTSDLGIEIDNSGTSGSPIYVGVDQTWYSAGVCGASFCRPIFNCAGACGGTGNEANYFAIFGAWVTVDNIEYTGSLNAAYGLTYNVGDVFENSYAHGWNCSGGSDAVTLFSFGNNEGFASTSSGIEFSVIDGSDTTTNCMEGIGGNPQFVIGNIVRDVTNGIQGGMSNVHDNFVGPILTSFVGGTHQNAISIFGVDNSETTQLVYNNVIANSTCSVCGGVVKLWINQFASTGVTGYWFNNVLFNNSSGNYIALGGHSAVNNGTHYFFNNTVDCTGNDCADDAGGTSGMTMTFHAINNHWITASTAVNCTYITCTNTTDLTQTVTTANGQGYSAGSTYAYQPTSGTGSTVGAGTNEQSLCTTINGIDATAGAACKDDTGYACAYNTSSHTVSCPDRTENARPASAAWDIGAYEFNGATPPAPPAPASNIFVMVR